MIKFNLLNFIDVKTGQELFNTFRKLTGITVAFAIQRLLQDDDNYSNYFCNNCIKSSKKGRNLCSSAFREYVKAMSKSTDFEPVVCPCHAGLIDIIAPIRVNGEVATFIVAGQCLFTKHNVRKARAHAKELALDEETYIEEYKKIRYITPEEQPILLDFIKKLAIFISGIASTNYNDYQNINKDILAESMLEGINNSFLITDTLTIACKELCSLYKISSAKVFQFNKSDETFTTLLSYKHDKKAPDLTAKYNNKTYISKIMDFWCSNIDEEASERQIEIYDMTKKSRVPKAIRDMYTDAGIYSVIGIKLRTTENTYVIMALLDSNPSRKWSDADLKFLTLIAKNVSVAIKQNHLTESLSNENKRISAILDSFKFPIYFKDLKGRFVNLNKSFCDYINADADDIIGKTCEEYFGKNTYKTVTDAEKFVMKTGQIISLDKIQDMTKGCTFDIKIFPFCDEQGKKLGVFVHVLNMENNIPVQISQPKKVAKTTTTAKKTKDSYTAKKSGKIYKKNA